VLGQRPAVLAWQVGQQPQHERPRPPAWLHPAEPARDPAQQLLQARLPTGSVCVYAVACGHRLIFGCVHNTGSSTVAALLCSPGPPLSSQVTIYGWSTKARAGSDPGWKALSESAAELNQWRPMSRLSPFLAAHRNAW
jgi:hypothetical protein